MPASKYFTSILSRKLKVFLPPSDFQVVAHLKETLLNSNHIIIVDHTQEIELVLLVAGFNLPSWSESLNLTGRLHEYLDIALKKKAKFVMILPDRDDDFIKVSISLVEQFGKLFRVNYEIVLVDRVLSGDELLKKILNQVFHGYVSYTLNEPREIIVPVKKTFIKKQHSSFVKRLILLIIGFILTSWIIFGANYILAFYTLNPIFSIFSQAASEITPGANFLATKIGMPVGELKDITVRAKEISSLSANLLVRLSSLETLLSLSAQKEDMEVLLENINFQQLNLQRLGPQKASYLDKLNSLRQIVVKITNLVPDIPELLGANKSIKYALIIQDNTEIRATGGFIQGFVLMQIHKGAVDDIQYFNASQTDQLLRGQVAAPADLTQALNQKNWYLRDANWDPDLNSSANRMAWFIDKELGGSPDVVITLNWQTLAAALNIVGPVNLSDFGGKISAGNWLEKYLQYAKADSGNSNMMMTLVQAIFEKLAQANENQRVLLVKTLLDQLDQRQVFVNPITFSAPGLGLVGWGGQPLVSECRSQHPCQIMQIQAIDSNVGLNRVNPYIDRSAFLNINIADTRTDYKYQLSYTNNSPKPGWPTGDYKNYLRVYLPKGVVVGDGDYQVEVVGNFVIVSKLLTVPYQKSILFEINFAQNVPATGKFHHQVDYINQSGSRPEDLQITYTYPKAWLASSKNALEVAQPGLLKYNTQISFPYKLDTDFVKWKNTP